MFSNIWSDNFLLNKYMHAEHKEPNITNVSLNSGTFIITQTFKLISPNTYNL